MSEPFIAEIRSVAFNFAPVGWALCAGQLLPINDNQALYALLGNAYGGDGRTTVGLPDLRGRIPVHPQQQGLRGQAGGVEQVTLTAGQMPAHTHTLRAGGGTGDSQAPTGLYPESSSDGGLLYAAPGSGSVAMGPTANAGGGQPHDNMQPSLGINFVIALNGIFPSRN